MVRVVPVIAVVLLLTGCSASNEPAAPAPPAAAFACSPASAAIETGALRESDDVLVLAETAGFVDGSQSTPALVTANGISVSVDPGARIDLGGATRSAWIARIVASARRSQLIPDGFGDDTALESLRRTTAYPQAPAGSGVFVLATIAGARSLPFTISCGGETVASGAIISPWSGGPVRTVLYDCGDTTLDTDALLVRPSCDGRAASAKDPQG
jgi:hypothetical protein